MTGGNDQRKDGVTRGGTAPAQRAGFREESGRLVVANAFLSMAFSALAGGAIVSLSDRRSRSEFVNAEDAVTEGSLWRLQLSARGGPPVWVTSRSCTGFSHTATPDADGSLWLRLKWSGLRVGAEPVDGEVVTDWLVPARGVTVLGELSARLAGHVTVTAIEFPCLGALGATDLRVEERLVLPLGGGVLVSEPRGLLPPGEDEGWEIRYPSESSLQLMCCYATLALSCRDAAAADKRLLVKSMARSNRMQMSVMTQPVRDRDGVWRPGFPLAVSLVSGDWVEAAKEYRTWAIDWWRDTASGSPSGAALGRWAR